MKNTNEPFKEDAEILRKAILLLSERPDALDNFVSYLSLHMGDWITKFANTPADLSSEFKMFAEMDIG